MFLNFIYLIKRFYPYSRLDVQQAW